MTTTPAPAPLPTLAERCEHLETAFRDVVTAAQLAHHSALNQHRVACASGTPTAISSAHLAERHLAEILDALAKLRARL